MMTAEFVRLAPAGRSGQWPVLVPRSLFTHYQPVIGVEATLLWLNLYEIAEGGADAEFISVEAELAARMRVVPEAIAAAAEALAMAGLLERGGGRWTVLWPGAAPPAVHGTDGTEHEAAGVSGLPGHVVVQSGGSESPSVAAPVTEPSAMAPDPAIQAAEAAASAEMTEAGGEAGDLDGEEAAGWNSDEAALQAVVQFYHQRIGMLGPSQFEKLRFWVEDQGMSSDVVALAIEETVQSAQTPRIAYVEGVLRNWYNDGIRTLAHLQNSKRARSQEVPPTTEGTPNAASFDAVDRDAVRHWKEMYSDEYDD